MVNEKSKKWFLFVFGMVFFLSLFFGWFRCKVGLHDLLESELKSKETNKLSFDFQHLIHSDIDSIFIFFAGISHFEISEAIGLIYDNDSEINEDQRLLIIINNRKIVFEETFWNNEIMFDGGKLIESDKNGNLKNPYVLFQTTNFYLEKRYGNFYYLKNNDNW